MEAQYHKADTTSRDTEELKQRATNKKISLRRIVNYVTEAPMQQQSQQRNHK